MLIPVFFCYILVDSRKNSTSRDVQIQGVGVPGFVVIKPEKRFT